MPPLDHLHPAIVHFPIALLAVVPFFFLLGALWPSRRPGLHAAGLLLLLLGLAGALLALATGEAAESLGRRTPELKAALAEHERAAGWTLGIFSALAGTWLAHLGVVRFRRRPLPAGLGRILFILWLLAAALGVTALVRTGHLGGHMVHDLHTHGGEP